ncbi:T9SS type A sorting domain-containing protein [Chryseobacterium proteolyticum]|uniref:T9SS type A sorting domain-containing protein n=1 Tax=Chryseobacterium proteolyticum TaxID=118127 RepID=UPI00398387B2
MKFNGTIWETVGTLGFSAGDAQYVNLAVAQNGTLYAGYRDIVSGGKATVKKFNGTSWETVGTSGFSVDFSAMYVSLVIAPNGTPYIGYSDFNDSEKTTVMKFNGTSWETVGPAQFSAGTAIFTNLAIASDGIPYIAYADGTNNMKTTVKKFDNNNWVTIGTPGFSAGGVNYNVDLVISPDNKKIIVGYSLSASNGVFARYYDAGELSIKETSIQNSGIYPNPVKGELNIKTEKKIKLCTLFDMAGRIILTTSSQKISVSALTKGVYMLNIQFADGTSLSQKVMKE